MPCASLPTPTPPALPPGITLAFPLPAFSGDLTLCCKLVDFPVASPPLPLPPAVISALGPLNAALDQVMAYFSALALPCPKE